MPKQQARIQECIKCGYTFTSYHIQQKCNECQNIDFIVKEFVSDETDNPKPITKGKYGNKK